MFRLLCRIHFEVQLFLNMEDLTKNTPFTAVPYISISSKKKKKPPSVLMTLTRKKEDHQVKAQKTNSQRFRIGASFSTTVFTPAKKSNKDVWYQSIMFDCPQKASQKNHPLCPSSSVFRHLYSNTLSKHTARQILFCSSIPSLYLRGTYYLPGTICI